MRLGDYIEIGGWVNHQGAYKIQSFDELPAVVKDTYAKRFLGTPTFHDKYELDLVAESGSSKSSSTTDDDEQQQPAALSLFNQLQASLQR